MVRCGIKGYGLMLSIRKWFDAGSKGMVWCFVKFWIKSTDSSILGRRLLFDDGSKSMVWCRVEWNGLMLNQRIWFDAGYCRRGWFNARSKNWFFCYWQKLIWWEKLKKTKFVGKERNKLICRQSKIWRDLIWRERKKWWDQRIGAPPRQQQIWRERRIGAPTKTI